MPVTKAMLVGMVQATIIAKKTDLSNNKVKSDLSFNADLSGWVTLVNSKIDKDLSGAALSGRRFHIVESPVFINPGKLANGNIDISGESLHHERAFRAYLKSLYNPQTHFAVGDLDINEILPPRLLSATTPVLPQNVQFRYKFSW